MAIDFSNIKFEVIDITTNATPDLFINQNGVTFSKRILEDMGYPQNVQYSISPEHKVFSIRACKSNEAKAAPFSKPKAEQTSTLSSNNKNLHDTLAALIANYNAKMRYKVTGFWDAENKVMYFDMSSSEESAYRAGKE